MAGAVNIDVQQISQELRIRPEIYLRLVTSFSNSLVGKMHALSDALAEDDRDQMRLILHEIKGTAGNLRLRNITEPETVLHEAVKAGDAQKKLLQHYEVLRAETEKLQQHLATQSRP